MRRALAIGLVALLLLPFAAAQAEIGEDPLTREERAFADGGPLRVAIGAEPPGGLVLNGTVVGGWGTELVELAALKVGVDVEFVPATTGADAARLLADGTVHLAGPLAARPDLEGYAPTTPFSWTPLMFVTHDGHDDLRDAGDLAGLRVSTIAGSRAEGWLLENRPDVLYVPTDSVAEGISQLAARELDAYLGPLGLVGYQLQQAGHRNVRPLGESVELNTIHFWGERGSLPLAILEKGRQRITEGELGLIHVKWTGFDLGPPDAPAAFAVPFWLKVAAAGVAGLLLVLGAGTLVLRHEVESRTRALEDLSRGLEEEIAHRTAALQRTVADLEAFARTTAHDLRAPLRGIDAYGRALLDDHEGELSDDARDLVRRMLDGTRRTATLLDGLLQLSRATSVPPEVRDVDLSAVAEEAARDLQAQAPQRKVRWSIQRDLRARGDPRLLALVITNLLDNAWKYTSKREVAEISLSGSREGDRMVFEVRDNGAGFDPKHADRLWEPFQRLHAESEFPGTGIGLTSVKRIVDRHGGKVEAEARPGQGAAFRFTLPDAPAGFPVG